MFILVENDYSDRVTRRIVFSDRQKEREKKTAEK